MPTYNSIEEFLKAVHGDQRLHTHCLPGAVSEVTRSSCPLQRQAETTMNALGAWRQCINIRVHGITKNGTKQPPPPPPRQINQTNQTNHSSCTTADKKYAWMPSLENWGGGLKDFLVHVYMGRIRQDTSSGYCPCIFRYIILYTVHVVLQSINAHNHTWFTQHGYGPSKDFIE